MFCPVVDIDMVLVVGCVLLLHLLLAMVVVVSFCGCVNDDDEYGYDGQQHDIDDGHDDDDENDVVDDVVQRGADS